LFPAYLLEFQGHNTFLLIWLAGLVFFCINIAIVTLVIQNYARSPWLQSPHTTSHKKER
jgi:hypothetical protein